MTENELFEQWYMGDNIKNSLEKEPEGHYTYAPANIAWNVWKARAELADKEKADLKASNDYLRELSYVYRLHISELQAQINELREALEAECGGRCNAEYNPCHARQALAKTAPQCLQEFENEVIERCAKVCDEAGQPHQDEIHTDAQWAAKVLAANIRALKG